MVNIAPEKVQRVNNVADRGTYFCDSKVAQLLDCNLIQLPARRAEHRCRRETFDVGDIDHLVFHKSLLFVYLKFLNSCESCLQAAKICPINFLILFHVEQQMRVILNRCFDRGQSFAQS